MHDEDNYKSDYQKGPCDQSSGLGMQVPWPDDTQTQKINRIYVVDLQCYEKRHYGHTKMYAGDNQYSGGQGVQASGEPSDNNFLIHG